MKYLLYKKAKGIRQSERADHRSSVRLGEEESIRPSTQSERFDLLNQRVE